MTTRIIALLFLVIAAPGCVTQSLLHRDSRGGKMLGRYAVVEMDKTLADIKKVPAKTASDVTLATYRAYIREHYDTGKALIFQAGGPRDSQAVNTRFEGTVHGYFRGAWLRDERDRNVVLIYRYVWMSGPMYTSWGHATFANGVWTLEPEAEPVKLYLKRRGPV